MNVIFDQWQNALMHSVLSLTHCLCFDWKSITWKKQSKWRHKHQRNYELGTIFSGVTNPFFFFLRFSIENWQWEMELVSVFVNIVVCVCAHGFCDNKLSIPNAKALKKNLKVKQKIQIQNKRKRWKIDFCCCCCCCCYHGINQLEHVLFARFVHSLLFLKGRRKKEWFLCECVFVNFNTHALNTTFFKPNFKVICKYWYVSKLLVIRWTMNRTGIQAMAHE